MKITRYKKVQKYLKFYYNNFGFHQPYQVLIDGTFCFSAFKEHIAIREQLTKYLNGNVKLLTTRCIIKETEKIAKKTHGALTILKQFGIHECDHKEPVSGSQCILSMVGKKNDKHYILATQDRDLQEKMRLKPGVPLLYLHNKSPTLEKPSPASYSKAGQTLEANPFMFISQTQNESLKNMKKTLGVEEKEEVSKVVIKKKKLKNPNPLSCKKKKKKPGKKQDEKKDKVIEGRVKKRKKSKHKSGLSQSSIQQ
ncbi:rRNA-processing protein UTP23 homolog isoform X1 [Maniola jurtina]|uniref:rRNA-processing protein UTP23 homolog isoform X1 n=1 Tax=Maniola jurtina TaxID=191418 RepID=UPI001E68EF84|nr:rRNA-processing protein UTP23 homolog isoform X1 [Maniola jurtina]